MQTSRRFARWHLSPASTRSRVGRSSGSIERDNSPRPDRNDVDETMQDDGLLRRCSCHSSREACRLGISEKFILFFFVNFIVS